jgi:hypothetical protein
MDIFARRSFSFANIPDLSGKIAIITGSNTGVSHHFMKQLVAVYSLIKLRNRLVKYVLWKWPRKAAPCK